MSAQTTQAIARDLRKAAVLVEERHGKRRSLLRLEDDDSVGTESPASMAKSPGKGRPFVGDWQLFSGGQSIVGPAHRFMCFDHV